jgi:tRNA (guanine37-N1)-methyltransferase
MVMLAEPLARCLAAIRPTAADAAPPWCCSRRSAAPGPRRRRGWSASAGAILLCGRYEGIDQRFIDTHVDVQLSLGDFVLSGGEIAAMALLDAVARLQPGVLNDAGSHQEDSFNPAIDGLLDCPHYTRPRSGKGGAGGTAVRPPRPDRALAPPAAAGAHRPLRPDLVAAARAAGRLTALDEAFLATLQGPARRYNRGLPDPLPGRPAAACFQGHPSKPGPSNSAGKID